MKTLKRILPLLLIAGGIIILTGFTSCTKDVATEDSEIANVEKMAPANGPGTCGNPNCQTTGVLDSTEVTTLMFMREEELLARDIYLAMKVLYPTMSIFNNIAASEQTHTNAIKKLILKYSLTDPAANHVQGVFVNPDIQALYNTLLAQGNTSLNDALYVGATIEDMDIYDLNTHIANDVDNTDILQVLKNLRKGSFNHIRAFNGKLKANGITYIPQYLTQAEFDAIVN